MRAAPLVAFGVAAYAVFLVATTPARFAAAQLESRMRDRVRVHDAHGTVWSGAARAEIALPGSGWMPMDNLAWRVQPAELLRGRVAFTVDAAAADLAAQGTIARSVSLWHVKGTATGSAAVLSTLSPLLSAWRPEGKLAINVDDLAWDERTVQGNVQADWSGAGVALAQVRPLGSYRATLRAEGTNGKLAISTLDGPLRIAGQGDIVFPSRFSFNGEARAQGPAAASLDPLLDLMGPRRADGARTLAWRIH